MSPHRRTFRLLVLMLVVVGVVVAVGVAGWPARGPVAARDGSAGGHAPPAPVDFTYLSGVLSRDGHRYEVGTDGDVVAVGDWDCDGVPTAALLRPSTGTVYAFAGWAGTDDVAGVVVGAVPGGVDIQASDADGDSCDDIVVTATDGSTTVLHARTPTS